jgi:hypothetical protein
VSSARALIVDNAIQGVTFSGKSYTAMVGTEVGGNYASNSVSINGEDEPDRVELASDRSQMRSIQKP